MIFLPKSLIAGLCFLALAGCSSFTKPSNETRVTEYDGTAEPGLIGTPYVDGNLKVDGCRVVQEGSVLGCIEYLGKMCKYTSANCTIEGK